MLTRRRFAQLATASSASLALNSGLCAQMAMPALSAPSIPVGSPPASFTLTIVPYTLEASPKHHIKTLAYNNQVPGPLLRISDSRPVTIDIHNQSSEPDIVHWHGLFLPPEIDGAAEEGTPMIPPGAATRITFTPQPAGFRWFHTHTFAGNDLRKAQYGGQHGLLMIDPGTIDEAELSFDREFFLVLHDWEGQLLASDDGSMMPMYEVSTINGKMLGFGEPLRVKQGERIKLHILNSSPTEVHWIALAGHQFQVTALDGNSIAHQPVTVPMLRLAPAERVCAIVEMTNPGVWILGEVRKHIQSAGMGIVLEYSNAIGAPKWIQPQELTWSYADFAGSDNLAGSATRASSHPADITEIPLTFDSHFEGHGSAERWRINGRSYPDTESPTLRTGQRYRLAMKNLSTDDHPIHLHRHIFEVTNVGGAPMRGLFKDVVLVPAKSTATVEFVADHPGNTLLHCHQQDHMDRGFMMVFRYA